MSTAQGKPRLIFVKGSDDKARHPRMLKLIRKAGSQLIRRRFGDIPDLTAALYAALVEHLERSGDLRTLPFDASACERATIDDLSEEKLRWFLGTARRERQYILSENTSAKTALTHMNLLERDRPSHNASVQIMLFADRLEVWNPGELPPPLTPELLRQPHASIPRNPLIAEPLYLVRYIEKAGTGILDMIDRCRSAALPEPDFEQRAGQWVVTLWRDWLTAEVLAGLGLNEQKIGTAPYLL